MKLVTEEEIRTSLDKLKDYNSEDEELIDKYINNVHYGQLIIRVNKVLNECYDVNRIYEFINNRLLEYMHDFANKYNDNNLYYNIDVYYSLEDDKLAVEHVANKKQYKLVATFAVMSGYIKKIEVGYD